MKIFTKKKSIVILIIFGLAAAFVFYLSRYPQIDSQPSYGITFSKKQAASLGLDWREAYLEVLDGLAVKKIRLPAYWDEVEPAEGSYWWEDIDWQIEEAGKRNVDVILALGARLPRWPECHYPDWVDQSDQNSRAKVLAYLETAVKKYQGVPWISAWQVENEPFLTAFGECPELKVDLLDQEIAMVKSLDSRPVIVTDSGELSLWIPAARRADIFGSTMYRDTYSKFLKRYIHYPIGPSFFVFKRNLAALFADPQEWIVIEMQGEPWGPIPFQNMTSEERSRTMDPEKFQEMIAFSRQTGFSEFYLWGAEWWLWEREQGRGEMWELAKTLFQ